MYLQKGLILIRSSNKLIIANGINNNGIYHPKKTDPIIPIKTKTAPPPLGVGLKCELLALGNSIKNLFFKIH